MTFIPKSRMAAPNVSEISPTILGQTTPTSDGDDLWEEMEALELEIGTDTSGSGGGAVWAHC